MPALRAQSTRRLLTNALQRTGALRSGDRVNLALWALDGDIEVDPVTLTQVAEVVLWHPGQEISDRLEDILAGTIARSRPQERSISQGDPKLAVRLARAGFESSGTVAAGATLATTLCWAGETTEAAQVLGDLRALAPAGDDQVRLAVALAEVTFWGEHRHEDAIAVLTEAAADAVDGTDPSLLAQLTEKLAGFELNTVRASAALAHAQQAAVLEGEELAASLAAPAAAASLAHLGRCEEALELIDRALPAAFARWPSLDGGSPASLRPHRRPCPCGTARRGSRAGRDLPAGRSLHRLARRDGAVRGVDGRGAAATGPAGERIASVPRRRRAVPGP